MANRLAGWVLLIVVGGFGLCLGVAIMISGSSLQIDLFNNFLWNGANNWFSMLSVFFYLISPMPLVLGLVFAGRFTPEDEDGNKLTSYYTHIGWCGFAFLLTLGGGVIFILTHSMIISYFCSFMNIVGLLVIFIFVVFALLINACCINKRSGDDYMSM